MKIARKRAKMHYRAASHTMSHLEYIQLKRDLFQAAHFLTAKERREANLPPVTAIPVIPDGDDE